MLRAMMFRAAMLIVAAVVWWPLAAQETAKEPAVPAAAVEKATPEAEPLASVQEGLAMRYRRFEHTMLQVAEYSANPIPSGPTSWSGPSAEQGDPAAGSVLAPHQSAQAGSVRRCLDEQEHVVVLMQGMLELLQSEDRKEEIEKEKARIRELIKESIA